MATRIGLLRTRSRARGAQLLHGQHKLDSSSVSSSSISSSSSRSTSIIGSLQPCTIVSGRSIYSDNSSRLRLLARLSSSKRSTSHGDASFHAAAVGAVAAVHRQPTYSLFLRSGLLSGKASLLSTTARPSQDDSTGGKAEGGEWGAGDEKIGGGAQGRSEGGASLIYNSGLGRYEGEDKQARLARLDDGDKYEDFVDLRLEEIEKLFPEGLAGGAQGALERATTRGTPAALLRREATDALIQSLDGFVEGGGASGIEGTTGEKWKESREARQHAGTTDTVAAKGGGEDAPEGGGDRSEAIGDVKAAAAEGAAAAEAAAAMAAAVAEAEAQAAGIGGRGEEAKGGDILGSGPIWDEMKALAESKRKPLGGVRHVVVQPGQRSYLLTGRRGSGKSCVLNQVVLHARSTGWIVLFVPDARNLVQKGIYCQPSPVFENLYDLPIQSLKRLKTLRTAHADQLKDIDIKDPEVLARHKGAKTLLDLVDLGVDNEELAGTVHYDAMRELLATTEAKVLLAVDEYNELFQPSHWHYGDNKLEAPHLTATLPLVPSLEATPTGLVFADGELAAVANPNTKHKRGAALSSPWVDAQTGGACLPPPPANGIVVCAMSGRHPAVKHLRKNKKWTPFEGVAGRLAKGVSVQVEPYSRPEFLRVVKRYARVEEVITVPLSDLELAKVHAKSDGLAEWVFDTCKCGHYRVAVPE